MHIYDWLQMYWFGEEGRLGNCYQCQQLDARLRAFIGEREAARIRRLVRKYPGKRLEASTTAAIGRRIAAKRASALKRLAR